jgi:hypothetical protein
VHVLAVKVRNLCEGDEITDADLEVHTIELGSASSGAAPSPNEWAERVRQALGLTADQRGVLAEWLQKSKPGDVLRVESPRHPYPLNSPTQCKLLLVLLGKIRVSEMRTRTVERIETSLFAVKAAAQPKKKKR